MWFWRKRPRPKIVIIGAGFGGIFAAKALRGARADVTVIDRQNHHLFQPLLYQVATAGISPAEIAWPIRRILRGHRNTTVLMAEVTGIDRETRTIDLGDRQLAYDMLILATGSRTAYFGNDQWAPHAPGLKDLDDATAMRRHLLVAFEAAENAEDEETRTACLTFVIAGGGPTGVELAGTIAELARFALAEDFRHVHPPDARILLIESNERVLRSYPEQLGHYACRALRRLGVEIRTKTRIVEVDQTGVRLNDGSKIAARTVLWAAGNAACPLAGTLGAPTDRAGRTKVTPHLHLPEDRDIFVIGDAAHTEGKDGGPLPGIAPVAKQQGRFVARLLRRRLRRRGDGAAFRYRDWGNLATIGRNAAIADLNGLRLKGFPAWLLWGLAHIYFLIGFGNPLIVMTRWFASYLTYERGARIITGLERSSAVDGPPVPVEPASDPAPRAGA